MGLEQGSSTHWLHIMNSLAHRTPGWGSTDVRIGLIADSRPLGIKLESKWPSATSKQWPNRKKPRGDPGLYWLEVLLLTP